MILKTSLTAFLFSQILSLLKQQRDCCSISNVQHQTTNCSHVVLFSTFGAHVCYNLYGTLAPIVPIRPCSQFLVYILNDTFKIINH